MEFRIAPQNYFKEKYIINGRLKNGSLVMNCKLC